MVSLDMDTTKRVDMIECGMARQDRSYLGRGFRAGRATRPYKLRGRLDAASAIRPSARPVAGP
jgi:hypothetical protein